jgi:hypothetical protein
LGGKGPQAVVASAAASVATHPYAAQAAMLPETEAQLVTAWQMGVAAVEFQKHVGAVHLSYAKVVQLACPNWHVLLFQKQPYEAEAVSHPVASW